MDSIGKKLKVLALVLGILAAIKYLGLVPMLLVMLSGVSGVSQ